MLLHSIAKPIQQQQPKIPPASQRPPPPQAAPVSVPHHSSANDQHQNARLQQEVKFYSIIY